MAVMADPILAPFRSGKGRQSAAAEALRDALDEIAAHDSEALAFCDVIRPLADRLFMVATEIGPTAAATVRQLQALIDRYERRHIRDDGRAA
jgi:hypothetical protein